MSDFGHGYQLLRLDGIRHSRARWFHYIRGRFDLVSFGEIADWIGRERGAVSCAERLRQGALAELIKSVQHGEFGPAHEKRCIGWLPRVPRTDMLGTLPVRLNYGQIVYLLPVKHLDAADLHSSRSLCLRWLDARQIAPPPWLSSPTSSAMPLSASVSPRPTDTRPKPSDAAVRLWMRGRVANWPDDEPAPTEDNDFNAALEHFATGLTRQEFRLVREEETPSVWRKQGRRRLWGQAKINAA